jgi:hypothetical protein
MVGLLNSPSRSTLFLRCNLPENFKQLHMTNRFRDQRTHPGIPCPLATLAGRICCDRHDRSGVVFAISFTNQAGGFKPIHLRHAQIHENQVKPLHFALGYGIPTPERDLRSRSKVPEEGLANVHIVRSVLHDKDMHRVMKLGHGLRTSARHREDG